MRARHLLAVPAGLTAIVCAQAAPYTPTFTGAAFMRVMAMAEPLSAYDYLEREKAYSYLDGARDSAEGRTWCDANQLKTPDLAHELAGQIAKLPPAERQQNAATLILRLLGRTFPCSPVKGIRP